MPTSFGLRNKLIMTQSRERRHALLTQLEAPHFNKVLSYFRYALLAFVDRKIWPMDEFIVNLVKRETVPPDLLQSKGTCSSALE
jgi:hypothetical protein